MEPEHVLLDVNADHAQRSAQHNLNQGYQREQRTLELHRKKKTNLLIKFRAKLNSNKQPSNMVTQQHRQNELISSEQEYHKQAIHLYVVCQPYSKKKGMNYAIINNNYTPK